MLPRTLLAVIIGVFIFARSSLLHDPYPSVLLSLILVLNHDDFYFFLLETVLFIPNDRKNRSNLTVL